MIGVGSSLSAKLGSHFILHGISDFLYLQNQTQSWLVLNSPHKLSEKDKDQSRQWQQLPCPDPLCHAVRRYTVFTNSSMNQKAEHWKAIQTRSHSCGKNRISYRGLSGPQILFLPHHQDVSYTKQRFSFPDSYIPWELTNSRSWKKNSNLKDLGSNTASPQPSLCPWGNHLKSPFFSFVNNNAYC